MGFFLLLFLSSNFVDHKVAGKPFRYIRVARPEGGYLFSSFVFRHLVTLVSVLLSEW